MSSPAHAARLVVFAAGAALALPAFSAIAHAQAPTPPPAPPAAAPAATAPANSLARQLGLSVYPAKGQTPEQQATDEKACSDWAQQQTGLDLNAAPPNADSAAKAAKAATDSATTGAAVGGAARGAVAGVAIGAIAGDAGKGAAIGATAGALGGRQARKQAGRNAAASGQKQAAATHDAKLNEIKKAMSVCLEGKGYTAK